MLKQEIQDTSEITKLNAMKIEHKVGNVKCSFWMQYDDVITNPRWRTDAILKIVFGYIKTPYWQINAKFGTEMKDHMPI